MDEFRKYRKLKGSTFGCTNRLVHVIVTDAPPIKQHGYLLPMVLDKLRKDVMYLSSLDLKSEFLQVPMA